MIAVMKIPKQIISITAKLEKAGFEAYIVGGCVRDLLRGAKPNDWDIATNAKPEQSNKLFPKSFKDKNFGLVTVLTGSKDDTLKEIEIMPYRTESTYSDKRHPDQVFWVDTIEQDLARRDFTINAMAIRPQKLKNDYEVIDLFKGREDLERKIIKTVGDPKKRFSEDALRMMRAVRFAMTLGKGWQIEEQTKNAIKKNSELLRAISNERIRDELMKVIMSENASEGIELFRKTGLLKYIIPELEEGYGIAQNKHHIYDCYEHNILSLAYAAKKDYNRYVRLTALLHDIAKPRTKKGEGPDATFYCHEIVGAKMTKKILERLKFSKKDIEKIVKLVRYHLFYYDVDEVTESSIRRLVRNVGKENIDELLEVRFCDRIGSGCPKAEPYKLRHLRYVVEKASASPISVSSLKVGGEDVMSILDIEPGQKIGQILDILLNEILEDPNKNKKGYLNKRIKDLGEIDDVKLGKMTQKIRKEITNVKMKKDSMLKEKYWVK